MYYHIRKNALDRNKEAVKLSCDISELRQGMVRPFRLTIQNEQFHDVGYLIFNYYYDGKIYITDFKVQNQGVRHGRLLHDFFLEVLPQIEEIAFEMELRSVKMHIIEGELFPNGISRNDLIAIYRHFGYKIDGSWITLHLEVS
ncbi:hypothetical protein MH215_10405 [Paenibacillus sp. ACRSA]|uniref:hypothetical protein n=1 Tax=Paenibacillus sp. ACRSA TaxID=2918211 RepID=UPI001EF4E36B|nr:hypothetical protein [Paenibacillus sp. ACRSA]MCG7377407.1 hypothetical protein [Paenibacillus sp. ACRSA]